LTDSNGRGRAQKAPAPAHKKKPRQAARASNPRINVTVDPNSTGVSRTAIITFTTADGKGSVTTTVFQA
jgi:hypothetical protein